MTDLQLIGVEAFGDLAVNLGQVLGAPAYCNAKVFVSQWMAKDGFSIHLHRTVLTVPEIRIHLSKWCGARIKGQGLVNDRSCLDHSAQINVKEHYYRSGSQKACLLKGPVWQGPMPRQRLNVLMRPLRRSTWRLFVLKGRRDALPYRRSPE